MSDFTMPFDEIRVEQWKTVLYWKGKPMYEFPYGVKSVPEGGTMTISGFKGSLNGNWISVMETGGDLLAELERKAASETVSPTSPPFP